MGESVRKRAWEREHGRVRVCVGESVWERVCGRECVWESVFEWVGESLCGREECVWEGESVCGKERECAGERVWEREFVGERVVERERVWERERVGKSVFKWVGESVCGREECVWEGGVCVGGR